jgi:hypothetical protein
MLAEISAVLAATPTGATRGEYEVAIVDRNCLEKATASTRRLSNQRLGELYGLDPSCRIFRALRQLWSRDESGRPLLALLVALARDPLLMASAPAILQVPVGAQLGREPVKAALREVVGPRLNDAVLDKVFRNVASSWAQAGHLEGRTFKFRRRVNATPGSAALALYLATAIGFRGSELLSSGWVATLDASPSAALSLALEAKRIGLIDLRTAGDVVELGFHRLERLASAW